MKYDMYTDLFARPSRALTWLAVSGAVHRLSAPANPQKR